MALSRPVTEKTAKQDVKKNLRKIIHSMIWESLKFVKSRKFMEEIKLVEVVFKQIKWNTGRGDDMFHRCRHYDYVRKLIPGELSSLRSRTEKNITKACNGKCGVMCYLFLSKLFLFELF